MNFSHCRRYSTFVLCWSKWQSFSHFRLNQGRDVEDNNLIIDTVRTQEIALPGFNVLGIGGVVADGINTLEYTQALVIVLRKTKAQMVWSIKIPDPFAVIRFRLRLLYSSGVHDAWWRVRHCSVTVVVLARLAIVHCFRIAIICSDDKLLYYIDDRRSCMLAKPYKLKGSTEAVTGCLWDIDVLSDWYWRTHWSLEHAIKYILLCN